MRFYMSHVTVPKMVSLVVSVTDEHSQEIQGMREADAYEYLSMNDVKWDGHEIAVVDGVNENLVYIDS